MSTKLQYDSSEVPNRELNAVRRCRGRSEGRLQWRLGESSHGFSVFVVATMSDSFFSRADRSCATVDSLALSRRVMAAD